MKKRHEVPHVRDSSLQSLFLLFKAHDYIRVHLLKSVKICVQKHFHYTFTPLRFFAPDRIVGICVLCGYIFYPVLKKVFM